jgi:hypothetical protein
MCDLAHYFAGTGNNEIKMVPGRLRLSSVVDYTCRLRSAALELYIGLLFLVVDVGLIKSKDNL